MTPLGPDILVRLPRPDDLVRIIELENLCFSDPWSPLALQAELVQDHLRRPLVAEYGGVVAGYIMTWKVVEMLHILNIATDPERRRSGVATALLNAAARQARQEGQIRVTLEVRRSNQEARSFYGRHGFTETGVRPRYYADNGEDALIMDALLTDIPEA
jgi:ribosomal-protein-alanine N-acetyltransferase